MVWKCKFYRFTSLSPEIKHKYSELNNNRVENDKITSLAHYVADFKYKVTHKEWDLKDDLKLFKPDDSKVKLILLPRIQSINMAYSMIRGKKETRLQLKIIINIRFREYKFCKVVDEVSSSMVNPVSIPILTKKFSLFHKLRFSNPYIFTIQCCKARIFPTKYSATSINLSLKYQRIVYHQIAKI